MKLKYIGIIIIVLFSSACSSTKVKPEIDVFAGQVTKILDVTERDFTNNQLDSQLAEEARQNLLNHNAFYYLEGRCRVIRPSTMLNFGDPDLMSFQKNCSLVAKKTTKNNSELVDFDNTLPESEAVRERNARNAVRALKRYASSLVELTNAETPDEISTATTTAITAINDLGDTAKSINKADNQTVNTKKVISEAGSALVSTLAKEILEARRYSILASIVRGADIAVQENSQAIAIWYSKQEREGLKRGYQELRDLGDNEYKSATRSSEELKKIESTYANLKKQSMQEKWRSFALIRNAHSAILSSLNAPADLARLTNANERIRNLISKTDEYVTERKNNSEKTK